jgi:hypothetical protein
MKIGRRDAALDQLDQQMADLLAEHHAAVQRLAEVRGLGIDPAPKRAQA